MASSVNRNFFSTAKKDKEAVEQCLELGLRYPEITSWIRASKEDVPLVKQFGLKETGILTSVSDYHIFLKLNKKRSEAMDDYLGIVEIHSRSGHNSPLSF